MTDDIALIVPYANFANFRSVRDNFYAFRQQQPSPVTVVELSLNGRFEAATESSDIRISDSIRSVMYQRSRLINLAIRRLPASIKKVAWMDGDICFDSHDWLAQLSAMLDDVEVVRPFDVIRLLKVDGAVGELVDTKVASTTRFPRAWGVRLDILPPLPAEPGYIGLLDRALVGEDELMVDCWNKQQLSPAVRDISPGMSHYCSQWAGQLQQRKFGELAGAASLMFAGGPVENVKDDRAYLQSSRYDPFVSLQINAKSGVYNWTNERQRSIVYFFDMLYTRNTDTHLPEVAQPTAETIATIKTRTPIPPVVVVRRPRDPVKPTVAILMPTMSLGGAEQWARNMVKYCTAFNWVVGVMSRDQWSDVSAADIVTNADVHVPLSRDANVITHVNQEQMLSAAVHAVDAVLFWGKLDTPIPTTAPVIFLAHGSCEGTQWTAALARDAGVTRFAAVSDNAAQAVRAVVPEVTAVWNGVDTNRLQPAEDREAVRQGWRPEARRYCRFVGYIGRLSDEKNVDSIIHAMAALPQYYNLVLVGCVGKDKDRTLQLARHMLAGRLIEIPGTHDIGPILSSLDCLVNTSPQEGTPLVVCEALLCQVPIVSTRVGAIPEMEAIARHPLVYSVPDVPLASELAAAIRTVCTASQAVDIARAYKFAKEHLTMTAMASRWEQYLREIILASQV